MPVNAAIMDERKPVDMLPSFDKAYELTNKIEGGYVNDPRDRGKETWHGISRRYHPSLEIWEIIDIAKVDVTFPANLEEQDRFRVRLHELKHKFYQKEFWDKLKLGQLVDKQELANEIYDTAVNMGTPVAVTFVQRALNVLNKQGELYQNLQIQLLCEYNPVHVQHVYTAWDVRYIVS